MQLGQVNLREEYPFKDVEPVVPLFDFRSVGRILRRRLPSIAALTLGCMVLAYGLTKLEHAQYSARSSLLLQVQNLQPFGRDGIFTETKFDNPMIESQLQVLHSPMLLSQVVQDLGLDKRTEFTDPPASPLAQRLELGIASLKGQLGIAPQAEEMPSEAARFQAAVDRLSDSVSVGRSGLTQVLNVTVTTTSPDLSAEIANAITQRFVLGRYSQRQDTAQAASTWFDQRIADLNRSAAAVEAQIASLGSETPATAADGVALAGGGSDATAALEALRRTISARIDLENSLAQVDTALAAPNPAGLLTAALAGDAGATLKTDYDTAMAAGNAAAVQTANDSAVAVLENLRDTMAGTLTTARAEEAAARKVLTDQRAGGLGDGQGGAAQLSGLESEAKIYRDMHESYLQSYLQTAQQQSFPSADATVIGQAVAPDDPTGTGSLRILMLAGVLGATLGIGTAFLRENADPNLRTRAALAQAVGMPVLGLLPQQQPVRGAAGSGPRIEVPRRVDKTGTNIVVLPQNYLAADTVTSDLSTTLSAPRSAYAETIRRIRVAFDARMALSQPMGSGRVLGFVSDSSYPGRSVAAMNYAQMLAVGGQRTLLVDLDWTHAYITNRIAPLATMGIPELMTKSEVIAPEKLFWLDDRSGLYFLPNRALLSHQGLDPAVFDTVGLTEMIRGLAQRFDHIVIDFAGLGETVDAAALGDAMHGYVVCAQWGSTQVGRLERVLRSAGLARSKVIGSVMTGVDEDALSRYEFSA
jgi:polysaccharide biosynthesis transport protein